MKIRFFRPTCNKDAEPDKKKSTGEFDVIPVHCPDCGGKWDVKVGKL